MLGLTATGFPVSVPRLTRSKVQAASRARSTMLSECTRHETSKRVSVHVGNIVARMGQGQFSVVRSAPERAMCVSVFQSWASP
eukprot:2401885-Lingulodinium_polyedra.AAC.1